MPLSAASVAHGTRAIGLALACACAGPAVAARHVISIDGMQFAPASLTVRRGDSVVWVNRDPVPHTATAAGGFDSKAIEPGKSWTYVAARRGRFAYLCTFHPTMTATLVVD
jgi:plastocyanin